MENKMLELVRLYQEIDQLLVKFYKGMYFTKLDSTELKEMWLGLANDEEEHLVYWDYLENRRYTMNILSKDDVDSIIQTLKNLLPEIKLVTDKAVKKEISVEKAFDSAVNIEFAALVSPMQDIFFNHDLILNASVFNPKLKYDEHLRRITSMAPRFFEKDPLKLTLIKSFDEIKKAKDLSLTEVVMDHLTGLKSRKYFFENTNFLIELASRENTSLALIIIDINDFKKINDRHGHLAGDKILEAIGSLLKNKTRSSDIAARFGGDEFVITLYDQSAVDAQNFIGHIKAEISQIRVKTEDGAVIKTSVSCGFSLFSHNQKTGLNALIANADKNMYEDKINSKK